MVLTSDYHTHTIYSHGKGTILDNAKAGQNIGLKEIGISDHGFSHPAFGIRRRYIKEMKRNCLDATTETGVKVLLGIESNVLSEGGKVDLPVELYDDFDIFLAGIHKFVMANLKSTFTVFMPNIINSTLHKKDVSKALRDRTTKTLINVIKNNPVDCITHLNFCSYTNVYDVCSCCADYGTYIELNAKKDHLTDEEIEQALKTDCRFIIGSDAHSPERVGEIKLVEELIKRTNFPLDRIDNIDGKLPDFRFKKHKENGR